MQCVVFSTELFLPDEDVDDEKTAYRSSGGQGPELNRESHGTKLAGRQNPKVKERAFLILELSHEAFVDRQMPVKTLLSRNFICGL